MKRSQQAGMTLIELVIVIIVLGIIAAVAAPKFADISGNAAVAALAGSKDGFKASYTIALGSATVAGAPTVAEVAARVDGLTCTAAGVCTSPDWDKDAGSKKDLTVTFYEETSCTTATIAGKTVQGYTYDINEAGAATCQTN